VNKRIKWFILRGLAAGAAGGLAAALFLRFVTETQIGYALRFEDATGIGLPPGAPAEFSRGTQHWGGMAAAVIYGTLLGVVLSIVVASLHHRIPARNEFERAWKVSAAAFVALVLIPGMKYPPNPPTVGDPDTIAKRSTEFMLLMLTSVLVVMAAWWLWNRLTEQGWDGAARFILGGGAFALMVVGLFVAWPASPDPINPPDNEAAPALQIRADAPPDVLAALLDTARATGDTSIRNPTEPDQPLDLSTFTDANALAGAPVALNTTKLVPHSYTTVIWHFRMLALAGLAIMWTVIAATFGLLADLHELVGARATRRAKVPASPPLPTSLT
jgi:hypothetical protein